MAYRPPVFYFQNAGRLGSARRVDFLFSSALTVGTAAQLIDGLLETPVTLTDTLLTEAAFWILPLDGSAESQALDAVIVAGHNWSGADTLIRQFDSMVDLSVQTLVPVADGVLFVIPLTLNTPYSGQVGIQIALLTNGGPEDSTVPSVTQLFATQARQMTRGPAFNWEHPWVRSQARFETPGGVSLAWQTGDARKTFRLTWENVTGDDLQILIDLREQTAFYSQPFFFLPPDDTFDLMHVEVTDSDWSHDFYGSATPGHRITLTLREVLG